MRAHPRTLLFLAAILFSSSVATAQVPNRDSIPNWPVPATWTRPRPAGTVGAMTDISFAIPFVAITPCRIADTRGNGFTGQAGGPALTTAPRTFQISGTVTGVPVQCGIPSGADAVSFQFTIVSPNTAGNLIAWPAGGSAPTVSVLNWSAGETALGNGTIVPLSPSGAMSVQINAAVGGATGHLVIDVNGYFSDSQSAGQYFDVTGSVVGTGVAVISAHNTAPGIAVRGESAHIGVYGRGQTLGVIGDAIGGTGIRYGVAGFTDSTVAGSAGVRGTVGGGATWAVEGFSEGNANNSAGVRGVGESPPNTTATAFSRSGVRGESANGNGTIGISQATGVGGFLMDSSDGTLLAEGRLGTTFGPVPKVPGPPWGVHAIGAIGATGVKAFLEPHPTDPTRVIQYIALEGPEARTYFRGRARFQRGLATIPVPEDFRMVTDPEGLTVQITPIGEMASFAVVRMALDQIVVKASRDVEFSYLVQGVRASFKDVQPVIRDGTFLPQSADARMPSALAERQKRVLIQNGVYKEDGTANMETARRLGLDQMWEKGAPATQQD